MFERLDPSRAALRIALLYAFLGFVWILFSDRFLLIFVEGDLQRLADLQTSKGWVFIVVTAAVLYGIIRSVLQRQANIDERLDTLNAELEARVEERTTRLAEVNRELEAFSYSVSHDLKAPLRGVDGYSQLLLLDHAHQLDTDGRELLEKVRAGVASMHALIEDMLAYSRMERRELDTRELGLDTLVDNVMASQELTVASSVDLRCAVPPLIVRADREGLALVVRNLVENAIKFSCGEATPQVRIEAEATDERVRICVSDNGVGFDMKYHDRIFDIFQRLHRAEDYPGTGVGLALVRKAVSRMGGRVWAESAPGKGARFYVELPR